MLKLMFMSGFFLFSMSFFNWMGFIFFYSMLLVFLSVMFYSPFLNMLYL